MSDIRLAVADRTADVTPLNAARLSARCTDCPARALALCSALCTEDLASFGRSGHRHHLSRGETLFWDGNESRSCGNLTRGVLKLSTSTADGREQIVGLVYPGDFVGTIFDTHADYSVTALTDAELCLFPRAEFERALERHPAMERLMLRRTMSDLANMRTWMLLLGRKSAQEKLATFLLDMARRLSTTDATPGTAAPFDLPLSRQDIADVLGLTIETVSRQMTKLRGAGLIRLHGIRTIQIVRPTQLAGLAEAA